MNLQNFESQIDPTILSRGSDYFKFGYVTSLEFDGETWFAEVDGSNDYTVSVAISDNGEILNTYCDCPYDWGEYCKHQVAVFFALKDARIQLLKTEKSNNNSSKKKESLESILSTLDKQTLVSLIMEYAETYKPMKNEIQFRYTQKSDITSSARQVIRGAINAVKYRDFVTYRDVNSATNGADTVLKMAEDKINSNEFLTAVSLGIIAMEEMMDLLNYCDDSNEYVGETIANAISEIHNATLSIPENHKDSQKIFDSIFAHSLSNIYDGWPDWRIELLSALVPLCYDKENRARLETHLLLPNNQITYEWGHDYEFRQMQQIQFDLINRFDDEATAQQFIAHNMDNIDFRYMAIKSAIENGHYDKAIQLCIEGEDENRQYPGIVKALHELQYTAYESANNLPKQKELALALFLDGDFKYYLKYKAFHSKCEWANKFEEILEKTEKNGSRGVYVQILVNDKHKPRLLAYCNKWPGSIVSYHTHLLPEYQHEVGQLFSDFIRQQASTANNRRHYGDVCALIKMCDKTCPESTTDVCAEIIQKYSRKPAFMDEMRKIEKL